MKDSVAIAEAINSKLRPLKDGEKYRYDTQAPGRIYLANQLLKGENQKLSRASYAAEYSITDGVEDSPFPGDKDGAIGFLSSVLGVRGVAKEIKGEIDKIACKNALNAVNLAVVERKDLVISASEEIKDFAEAYVKAALGDINNSKVNLKFLVNYEGQSTVHKTDSKFKDALNTLLNNNPTQEQLVAVFDANLGKEFDKKVITQLAQKHPEKLKEMLSNDKEGYLLDAIQKTSLKEIGGESLLKFALSQEAKSLSAEMMKRGFVLSETEIARVPEAAKDAILKSNSLLQGEKFTANDQLRLAIMSSVEESKVDVKLLATKPSPLYLAQKTGQTALASALREQGYKLKRSEQLQEMRQALGEKISITANAVGKKIKSAIGKGKS